MNLSARSRLDGASYVNLSIIRMHASLMTVTLESVGGKDLRPPDESCLQDANGVQNFAFADRLTLATQTHYQGNVDFPTDGLQAPVEFLYACSAQYQPIIIID